MAWARWSASVAAQAPPTAPAPGPSSSPVASEDPSSDEDDPSGEPVIWEVIGGGRNSGLQVRTGQSLSSPVASSRLSTGALVRQRRLLGNRLHYALLEGAGPPHGWVTITLGNKALLVLKSCKEEAGEEEEEQAAEAAKGSSSAPEHGTDGDKALAGGGSREVKEHSGSDQTDNVGVGGGEGADLAKAAAACSSCGRDFRWSDFAEGDYAEGWDCENLATCGNGSFNCGPFRWFCDHCQVDVCRQCFERRQGEVPAAAARVPGQASKPCSKFAWDHPLSQAEGRVRCLASDTVAGNMRRLTELQDRNADLEAERGVLLARVEHLEGLLRRCCQPPSDGGPAAGGGQGLAATVGGEDAGARAAAEEAALGGGDELSLMLEAPAKGSAVTCLCFGQERSHLDHVLLAIAYADGPAVLYRCDRQARASPLASAGNHPLFPRMDASAGDGGTGSLPSHPLLGRAGGTLPAAGSSCAKLVALRRLTGHTRGVSSMSFGPLEEQLLTASRDRSLRIWDVSSGELRAVFTDACLVGAAAFLPLHAGTFVASILGASSLSTPFEEESRPMRHSSRRASLRLVSAQTSSVLHALPAASDVHALCFDGSGRFLLAGTRRSSLLALEVTASGDRLLPRLRVQLGGVGKVTSIVHAPVAGSCSEGRQRLLIGSEGREGSQVSVAECVYAPQSVGGHLLSIVAQRQVFASEGPLPLRYCYCPSGAGLLVSCTVDGSLLLCHLDRAPRRGLAAPHRAAVEAVAASSCGALVASADAKGCVAVWRCRAAGSEADQFAASSPDKVVEDKSLGEKAAAGDHVGAKRAKRGTKVKVKLPRRSPSKD